MQAWLGHHAASFTMDTYVHLLSDDLPDAAFLDNLTGSARPTDEDGYEAAGAYSRGQR